MLGVAQVLADAVAERRRGKLVEASPFLDSEAAAEPGAEAAPPEVDDGLEVVGQPRQEVLVEGDERLVGPDALDGDVVAGFCEGGGLAPCAGGGAEMGADENADACHGQPKVKGTRGLDPAAARRASVKLPSGHDGTRGGGQVYRVLTRRAESVECRVDERREPEGADTPGERMP